MQNVGMAAGASNPNAESMETGRFWELSDHPVQPSQQAPGSVRDLVSNKMEKKQQREIP